MNLTERQQEIQSAIEKAFKEINKSKTLKQEFSNSPVGFVEKFTELKLTKEEIIEVVTLSKAPVEDLELNEEQLEAIAGGADEDDEHNGFTWEAYVYFKDKLQELFN